MLKKLSNFFQNWLDDDPFTQSAAVAYYAVFSMPGLLIIIMAIGAQFLEQQHVETQVLGHIRDILGASTAETINKIIDQTQEGERESWAMLAGLATLVFGATGLFIQLQRTLNQVWDIEISRSAPFLKFVKTRALALGLILAIGFLLLISLTLTTTLNLLGEILAAEFSRQWLHMAHAINAVISYLTITALFALIYKILPDAFVKWRYAFQGGALAAILFTLGEYAMTTYFEMAKPQSAFGAAGSIILLMLWVSYSCLILLMGAEFAKIREEAKSGPSKPTEIAKKKKQ